MSKRKDSTRLFLGDEAQRQTLLAQPGAVPVRCGWGERRPCGALVGVVVPWRDAPNDDVTGFKVDDVFVFRFVPWDGPTSEMGMGNGELWCPRHGVVRTDLNDVRRVARAKAERVVAR